MTDHGPGPTKPNSADPSPSMDDSAGTSEPHTDEPDELRRRLDELTDENRHIGLQSSQLFTILDALNEAVFVVDPATYTVLYSNRFGRDLFGEDPAGLLCYRAFQGMDDPCEGCPDPILLTGDGLPVHWEYHSERTNRDALITDRRINWPDGRIVCCKIGIDVTEAKRQELALRESEQKYRLLVEKVDEAIMVVQGGELRYVNPKCAESTGYLEAELLSMTLSDLLHPDDREKVLRFHRQRLEGQKVPHRYPARIVDKSGRIRWVEFDAVVITWEGQPASLALAADVTHRVEAERALVESEYRYRELVENANEGIFVIQDGLLRFHNRRSVELTGFSGEELVSQPFYAFVHPDDQESVVHDYGQALQGTPIFGTQFRLRLKSGDFIWAEVNAVPITWDGRLAVLGFLSDIHDRKQTEHRLREALAKLKAIEVIVNRSPAIVFLWRAEPGWSVEFVSDNVRQLGYEPDAFSSGKVRYADVIHADDLGRVASEISRCADSDVDECSQVYRVVTASGEVRWVEDRTLGRRDAHGTLTHYQGIVLDVTERVEAEESLRLARDELEHRVEERTAELSRANEELRRQIRERKRAEDRLKLAANIIEVSNEGVVITDALARIVDVNDAFCRITGYARQEVLGRNPRMMRSGRHAKDFYRAMWESLRETGHWSGEIWDRRKDGEIYPKLLSMSAVRDEDGKISNYVGIFSDITKMKETEAHLHALAHFDPLTSLPNRLLFRDRLQRAIVEAQRNRRMVALMLLDLDRFKYVNDTMGHQAGDQLLVGISERLSRCVRESDTVARLGGDEFAVVLTDVHETLSAAFVARRIVAAMAAPLVVEGREIRISTSVGITMCPADGTDVDRLFRNADLSLYRAKAQGRNNFQFFSEKMNQAAIERAHLELALRAALEKEELILFYQPILDFETGMVVGAEALLRWQHPTRGLISPDKFVPLAEDTGLIIPIGEWVLRTACQQVGRWVEAGLPELRISVNVSARQMVQNDLALTVTRALDESGLPPKQLELELTESAAMKDAEGTIKVFSELKKRGITIAIDDFGTGYSSLSHLKRLPIDKLKIDRSFIESVHTDPDDAAIVSAIVAVANSLKHKVVAEGVESEEQLSFLRQHRCDEWQGYYFSRPVPPDEFAEMLRARKTVPDPA